MTVGSSLLLLCGFSSINELTIQTFPHCWLTDRLVKFGAILLQPFAALGLYELLYATAPHIPF